MHTALPTPCAKHIIMFMFSKANDVYSAQYINFFCKLYVSISLQEVILVYKPKLNISKHLEGEWWEVLLEEFS